MKEFITFANFLADEARKISTKYFRQNISIELKNEHFGISAVTNADREIEKLLSDLIRKQYPDHSIQGEEFGINESKTKSKFRWVIDPIDGTSSFICGKPTFTTLIALVDDAYPSDPIVGIIDQPILQERWVGAKGFDSEFNGAKLSKLNGDTKLQSSILSTCGWNIFKSDFEKKCFEEISAKTKLVSYGGDSYSYGLLASGYIDIIVEATLKYHDIAALIPVLKGAGCIVTDWNGDEVNADLDGKVIASASKVAHSEALEIIKKNKKSE